MSVVEDPPVDRTRAPVEIRSAGFSSAPAPSGFIHQGEENKKHRVRDRKVDPPAEGDDTTPGETLPEEGQDD